MIQSASRNWREQIIKAFRIVAVIFNFLVGAFGLMGGYAAISTPEGPFGISPDLLKHGPFSSFLIPGLALFIVIGLGHIFTGVYMLRRGKFATYAEGIQAAITLGWILIQCWVMEEVNGMHIAVFSIGAVQGLYAMIDLARRKQFPFNLIRFGSTQG